MSTVFAFTKMLVQERQLTLQALEQRKNALPPYDYHTCRRALLSAISELEILLRRCEGPDLLIGEKRNAH
jgi:hypothetical protein